MFCCQRKEAEGLKDQAGNHKRDPTFSFWSLKSAFEQESHSTQSFTCEAAPRSQEGQAGGPGP